jgi:hypothetical protein
VKTSDEHARAVRGLPVPSALAHALLAHFEQRFGEQAQATAATLGLSAQQLRTQAECDSELLARVLFRLDAELARGDRAEITAAGRHLARTMQGSTELPTSTTPELFFSLCGSLWERHFRIGDARVCTVGRGYGRLEIRGQPRRPVALSLALLGLIEEGLQIAGAHGVSVRLTSCSALGDELDGYEATWT